MKLAGIFQDLEHLYDFQTIGYGSHFVFQNEAKIMHRHVLIAINIHCKFGKDMFIMELDIKVYVKTCPTDARTHACARLHVQQVFYNLPTTL